MFEWGKTSNKKEVEEIEEEEVENKIVEEDNKPVVVAAEEEHYTIYESAKMLGISNTLLREKLAEYKIKSHKINGALVLFKRDLEEVKRRRVVDGVRKLSCKEDFELCEECMERILK